MNYIQHPYPFTGPPGLPVDQSIALDPTMAHPSMVQTVDGYIYPFHPFDTVDFHTQPIIDYEEYAENLSRPRLTKEQVETLEAQFQAHPKPNSNVKRQLAAQTNLSLPRVAVSEFSFPFAKVSELTLSVELVSKQTSQGETAEATRGVCEDAKGQGG